MTRIRARRPQTPFVAAAFVLLALLMPAAPAQAASVAVGTSGRRTGAVRTGSQVPAVGSSASRSASAT